MAGFSQQEQIFLAALVGLHRRQIPADFASALPIRLHRALLLCLFCIRLSWVFCRTREDDAIPAFHTHITTNGIDLRLPEGWMLAHPLTIADLEFEILELQNAGLNLHIRYSGEETHD